MGPIGSNVARLLRRWLGFSVLCVAASAAHGLLPADAPLPWGQRADRQTCPDEGGYLWLPLASGAACLRYFGATDLRSASTLIVYMTGDRDQSLNVPWAKIENNTQQAQDARAAALTRRAGMPVVVLARPGTYGSSGDHRQRRRLAQEFAPIDAGLDALKRRYGVRHFVLWGHSGGATAAAAMLTLGRTDISCAVMTSSTFAYLERWRMRRGADREGPSTPKEIRLAEAMYDPLVHVEDIVPDSERTVYLLGDPRDTITPFEFQARFADALQRAGHRVVLREENGIPPGFHDLRGDVGLLQAGQCANQNSETERSPR